MTVGFVKKRIAFFLLFVLFLAQPSLAANKGIAAQFNWQAEWGSIKPDTIIPSVRHGAKKDINNAVENCGIGDTDYSKIGSYFIDINGDGAGDYITEAHGYFSQGYNKQKCPVAICTASSGCNISLYLQGPIVQVLSDTTPSPECPAKPEDNKTCRPECPALANLCPQLFIYKTPLIWDGLVLDWSFIPVAQFNSFHSTALRADGSTKYHVAYNNNPILKSIRNPASCTLEEMDFDNNNEIDEGEGCVKYQQFVAGRFVDLYNPVGKGSDEEKDERITTEFFNCKKARVKGARKNGESDCYDEGFKGPGIKYKDDWRNDLEGVRLYTKSKTETGELAYQIPDYVDPDKPEDTPKLICKQIKNTTGKDLFMPPRSNMELSAFHKAIAQMKGIAYGDCAMRFTPWVGQTSCPSDLVCDEIRVIAAERRCQRSSSAYGSCGECSGISDPQPLTGFINQCTFTAVCSGPSCGGPGGEGGGEGGGGSGGDGGGGSDCLSADSMVLMGDGSEKAIAEIRPGDLVMGFEKSSPLASVKPVKVKAVLITNEKDLIQINDMRISPDHLLTMDQGLVARASIVKVGSDLVGVSGQPVKVSKIMPPVRKTKAFNLDLEDADGYVAEGVRVLKEPIE